jgi:hypothetical protein
MKSKVECMRIATIVRKNHSNPSRGRVKVAVTRGRVAGISGIQQKRLEVPTWQKEKELGPFFPLILLG